MPDTVTHSLVTLLSVQNLRVSFATRSADVQAVDGVSFSIRHGEIVGLVGESGSGKSTLAFSLIRLVPKPGRIVAGVIQFEDLDLLNLSASEMRDLRGRDIALIVQDALAAMNPVTTVEEQVGQVVHDHEGGGWRGIHRRSLELLRQVEIPRPDLAMKKHAHELSGGMQQRVIIASALILNPKLLIADEPTTALDVTVQAQILALLRAIRDEHGTSILFVSHDLVTVAEICDRILVMYAGQIVESSPTTSTFQAPMHPYTQALLAAVPAMGGAPPARLEALGGSPPDPAAWPTGCRFHPRCPLWRALGSPSICTSVEPKEHVEGLRSAKCHFTDESQARWQAAAQARDQATRHD